MFIPLCDENEHSYNHIFNNLIILTCIVVFFYAASLVQVEALKLFLDKWALHPWRLFSQIPVSSMTGRIDIIFNHSDSVFWKQSVSYAFLHGSFFHLLFNMYFLWIFGDNVEFAMGHIRYVLFFFLGCIISGLMQIVINGPSPVPMIGASGAIAAIMGAYMFYFPKAKIAIGYFGLPIPRMMNSGSREVRWKGIVYWPSWICIPIFFAGDLIDGAYSIGHSTGVAHWAHLGGFVFGYATAFIFKDPGVVFLERKIVLNRNPLNEALYAIRKKTKN